MIKRHITGFVVGVCVIITALCIWAVYSLNSKITLLENGLIQLNSQVVTLNNFATQVATLINKKP